MKRIEDIEKQDWEELEQAALREEVSVPAGLEERIKLVLAAKASLRSRQVAGHSGWLVYASLAVAAGLAALGVLLPHGQSLPQDSFSDPYLAYAQVEATFQKISDKMELGVGLASKAGETAGKPVRLMNKISEQ